MIMKVKAIKAVKKKNQKKKKKHRRNQTVEEEEEEEEEEDGNEDEEEEEEEEVPVKPALSLKEKLKAFDKMAQTGQLFLKYTGKRRRKPQDRIVKVSFDDQGKPKQISWGSGSRHIDFNDILYIAHGHWTPVFASRKDQLDPALCFSVVGRTQILDVQAQTKDMAELWVKGLRKLIGQTDEKADQLSKEAFEKGNLPGSGSNKEKSPNVDKQVVESRTTSLMLLQQDLFVMTTTTVFRNLEEERIWEIDQSVRDKFNPKALYEEALRSDVPWRQWSQWIREKIVAYLKENNKVLQQQSYYAPTIMTPQIQQPYMTPQMMQQTYPVQQQQQTPVYQQYPQTIPNQYTQTVQQTQFNPNLQQGQYNPNAQQNQDNCSMM